MTHRFTQPDYADGDLMEVLVLQRKREY